MRFAAYTARWDDDGWEALYIRVYTFRTLLNAERMVEGVKIFIYWKASGKECGGKRRVW